MCLSEIIIDIHALNEPLAKLEETYGLLSEDFYRLYQAGEIEQTRDFIQWVGLYETRSDREQHYRNALYQHLRELREKQGWTALALTPQTV